ncbi:MAG: TfoX/Sxy family protein [Candidatus Nomurabacteria bacterium]|nr:MAG: TfoX/Sxy family protein [Candidatus Nomurabacteria bacterium]
MAYDEKLAERLYKIFITVPHVDERKMFGGLVIMVNGNLCCGIIKDKLVVRVGKEKYPELLKHKHAQEMLFTGRPMRGVLNIKPKGIKTKKQLEYWVEQGLSFVQTLPEK